MLLLLCVVLFCIPYLQEGFTSCGNLNSSHKPPYTCKDCTTAPIKGAGYPCFWNKKEKKCGSFAGSGYTKQC